MSAFVNNRIKRKPISIKMNRPNNSSPGGKREVHKKSHQFIVFLSLRGMTIFLQSLLAGKNPNIQPMTRFFFKSNLKFISFHKVSVFDGCSPSIDSRTSRIPIEYAAGRKCHRPPRHLQFCIRTGAQASDRHIFQFYPTQSLSLSSSMSTNLFSSETYTGTGPLSTGPKPITASVDV
jgi:hypothetical protein